jgi:hypothetical protein
VTVGIGFGSTVATKMFVRTGTRPIIVSGALLAAGGILWLSRIPVDGTYLGNLLAPLVVMGAGLGLLYAGVQTAANAGVPQDQAGLAAALITSSFQLGSALGLAVFSGIATSRTSHLLAAHTPPPGGTHRRIPAGPARQRPLPRGSRSHRAARLQHPRRTRRRTRNPTKPGTLLRPRITQHNEIPGWRSTPSRDSLYRRVRIRFGARPTPVQGLGWFRGSRLPGYSAGRIQSW